MKKLILLIIWLSIFSITSLVSARICTMEYAPVCSVEWKTYSNMCAAWDKEIAYNWECKENFMNEEDRKDYHMIKNRVDLKVKNKIDNVLNKLWANISSLSNTKQIKTLDTLITKIDKLNNKSRNTKAGQIRYYVLKYIVYEIKIIKNWVEK